nr:hypothetical protein [Candidatus Njordarchaeum guaymaensis]
WPFWVDLISLQAVMWSHYHYDVLRARRFARRHETGKICLSDRDLIESRLGSCGFRRVGIMVCQV